MPRKIPTATDWRPVDVFEAGATILKDMPERQIWGRLAALPNWDPIAHRSIGAFAVIKEALVFFVKARMDHEGRPRVATVKSNLTRIDEAVTELRAALEVMDLRSQQYLKEAAGAKRLTEADYNGTPLNESPIPGGAFSRGHSRIRLFKAALAQVQAWTSDALRQVPYKDERLSDEPGLYYFVERMAHVWETYGGVRFVASRKRGSPVLFIHGLLNAAGFKLSEAAVARAARAVSRELETKYPDRIIVAPEDEGKTLAELARRKPVPKKGKQSANQ